MIVKTHFKGPGMMKYAVLAFILKIVLLFIWIGYILIPKGSEFITILNDSLNNQLWNVRALLTPVLIIILMFGLASLLELLGVIAIMWLAKRELDNRF